VLNHDLWRELIPLSRKNMQTRLELNYIKIDNVEQNEHIKITMQKCIVFLTVTLNLKKLALVRTRSKNWHSLATFLIDIFIQNFHPFNF